VRIKKGCESVVIVELTTEEKEKLMTVYENIKDSSNYIEKNYHRLKIGDDAGLKNVRDTLHETLKLLENIKKEIES
jgi:hypothetical protein